LIQYQPIIPMPKIAQKLPFLLLLCCLFACKKGNNNPQSSLIQGKWVLQRQEAVTYINGTEQTDFVTNTSADSTSAIQFNSDGSFVSTNLTKFYSLGSSSPIVGADTVKGNYSFSHNVFNLSKPGLGFWNTYDTIVYESTAYPTTILVSQSAQINQLTATTLTLHVELVLQHTFLGGAPPENRRIEMDYAYSK
jgi:hypothetical protein